VRRAKQMKGQFGGQAIIPTIGEAELDSDIAALARAILKTPHLRLRPSGLVPIYGWGQTRTFRLTEAISYPRNAEQSLDSVNPCKYPSPSLTIERGSEATMAGLGERCSWPPKLPRRQKASS
jgi:hypothetical protein